jgi:hypothetical protein
VIAGVYFSRLHIGSVPGLPNPQGVQITSVHKNGVNGQLELVHGDRLRGVGPSGPVPSNWLPGTRIGVLVNGAPYEIRIAAASPSEQFWVGAQLPIWRYKLYYSSPAHPHKPEQLLCSEADRGPDMMYAIVFGGDLYDPDTHAITVGPETDGWINIACTGSAIYKMHKIGYTEAAQARLGIPTSPDQRRAMLNAWTSDVCGTGRAFTHQGEPITLRESLGLLPGGSPYVAPVAPPSREAIWGPGGAVCLDTHRLDEPGLTEAERAELYDAIGEECGGTLPPPCSSLPAPWSAHGSVVTGNP